MKKIILIAITCIVVAQKKTKEGWLTACRGIDDMHGLVVFDEKVVKGQAVSYEPFIGKDRDVIHGKILNIVDAPVTVKVYIDSSTGKSPE